MRKKTWRELFKAWFAARYKLILLFLGFLLIEGLVPRLYHVPLYSIYYSQSLVCFMAAAYGLGDLYHFIKKYDSLMETCYNLSQSLEKLPQADCLLEQTYQQIAEGLMKEKRHIEEHTKNQMDEMKDYYTMWAHQIKTPIAAMRLLLQEEGIPSEVRSHLEIELFNTEQYVEMVMQYLRLESMASDMVLKQQPLHLVVKQCVKKYALSFIARKISLDFQPFEKWVTTDEKWLSFVIGQILSNSLKYTRPGGKVAISCCIQKEKTILMIKDTGIGIKEEDLPRVCDRGFTGYNGRLDKRSTGIGLYLCRKVIDKLSHDLIITSRLGEGTMVKLVFYEDKEAALQD